jgi:hypothetical protein
MQKSPTTGATKLSATETKVLARFASRASRLAQLPDDAGDSIGF